MGEDANFERLEHAILRKAPLKLITKLSSMIFEHAF